MRTYKVYIQATVYRYFTVKAKSEGGAIREGKRRMYKKTIKIKPKDIDNDVNDAQSL